MLELVPGREGNPWVWVLVPPRKGAGARPLPRGAGRGVPPADARAGPGPEGDPLDVVCVPAAQGAGLLEHVEVLRPVPARGAALLGRPGAEREAEGPDRPRLRLGRGW